LLPGVIEGCVHCYRDLYKGVCIVTGSYRRVCALLPGVIGGCVHWYREL
jgi:hypothetical protein